MSGEKIVAFGNEETVNTDLIFYDTKDVARILRCSIQSARDIMHRKDFPLIQVAKNMRVSKSAFEKWAMERRS